MSSLSQLVIVLVKPERSIHIEHAIIIVCDTVLKKKKKIVLKSMTCRTYIYNYYNCYYTQYYIQRWQHNSAGTVFFVVAASEWNSPKPDLLKKNWVTQYTHTDTDMQVAPKKTPAIPVCAQSDCMVPCVTRFLYYNTIRDCSGLTTGNCSYK